MLKNAAAKVMAAKLLTVSGVALAATGGIAAAASTGHLPNPLPHSEHASDVAVAAVASHAKPTATATESATESETESQSSSAPTATPSATPSPSLRGLCQSWLSRPHVHGKADTNPAFTFLVTTAGGTDSVNGYCTTLLASGPGHPVASPTSVQPTAGHATGKPSKARPSAVPSHSHPSGKPSAVSSPSTRPTGR